MTRLNKIIAVIVIVLVAALLITTGTVTGLYAKNRSSSQGAVNASVAKFVFDVSGKDGTSFADLSNVNAPGKSQIYTLIVTNKNSNAVSEVAISYDITLTLNGNMPLTVSVLKGTTVLKSITIDESTTAFPQTLTVSGTMDASASTAEYIVKAEWPKDCNSLSYASGATAASISMTVTAEQEN